MVGLTEFRLLSPSAISGPGAYDTKHNSNEGKSVASFFHQAAAWFPDMFCYFYFVKNHRIAKNSTATKGRGKISNYLKSLEF